MKSVVQINKMSNCVGVFFLVVVCCQKHVDLSRSHPCIDHRWHDSSSRRTRRCLHEYLPSHQTDLHHNSYTPRTHRSLTATANTTTHTYTVKQPELEKLKIKYNAKCGIINRRGVCGNIYISNFGRGYSQQDKYKFLFSLIFLLLSMDLSVCLSFSFVLHLRQGIS